MGSGLWARVERWGVHRARKFEVLTAQVGEGGASKARLECGVKSLGAEEELGDPWIGMKPVTRMSHWFQGNGGFR